MPPRKPRYTAKEKPRHIPASSSLCFSSTELNRHKGLPQLHRNAISLPEQKLLEWVPWDGRLLRQLPAPLPSLSSQFGSSS